MKTIMLITLILGGVAFIFGMGQTIGIGYVDDFSDVLVLAGGITAAFASLIWFWDYLEEKEETDDQP